MIWGDYYTNQVGIEATIFMRWCLKIHAILKMVKNLILHSCLELTIKYTEMNNYYQSLYAWYGL